MCLAVARIVPAHNIVARDNDEPATKWPSLELSCGRVAHQEVPSKGRDDQCVEGVNHKLRVASGKLDLNQSIAVAHNPMPSSDNLIWIDLEMTGLKPESDSVI